MSGFDAWTSVEDRMLRELRDAGLQQWESADVLSRSGRAVNNRAKHLQIARRPERCPRCKELMIHPQYGAPKKFCSKFCREFRGPVIWQPFNCQQCGTYVESPKTHDQIYCSKRCSQRASYLRGTSGSPSHKLKFGWTAQPRKKVLS